jgi:hypothetical protein
LSCEPKEKLKNVDSKAPLSLMKEKSKIFLWKGSDMLKKNCFSPNKKIQSFLPVPTMTMKSADWFKVLGALFSIVMIGYVTAQDSDNSNNHKGLDTTIVVTQALMIMLLFTSEWFPTKKLFGKISYLFLAWVLLFVISTICVLSRFDLEKDNKLFLAIMIGNLALMLMSNLAFAPKGKAKEIKTEEVVSQMDEETKEAVLEGLQKKVEDLDKKVRDGKAQYADRLAVAKRNLAEVEQQYSPSPSKSPQTSPSTSPTSKTPARMFDEF